MDDQDPSPAPVAMAAARWPGLVHMSVSLDDNDGIAPIVDADHAAADDDDHDGIGPSAATTAAEAAAVVDALDFTPVPVRPRADGWTAAKQVRFVRWIGDLGSVGEAAAMVGMTREGAYRLRKRPGAASFAEAWDNALLWAGESLFERAVRRAIDGVAVAVIRNGRVTGATRQCDDRLLIALMTRAEGRTRRLHRRKKA